MEQDLLIVRRNDFLAQLNHDDYDLLDVVHNIVIAEKNAYIYFDAHQHNNLYFVKEGFIRLGNIDDEGNECVREILQPGDIFGQITLLPGNLEGEFAQAHKTRVALCSFTVANFQSLLHKRPELAIMFAQKIGSRMKRVENRLLNLLQKDVRTRILYFFWTLVPANHAMDDQVCRFDNYLTHEDIARLTGTSRQTVSTLVGQFHTDGILTVDRQHITIHSLKLLHKEARIG